MRDTQTGVSLRCDDPISKSSSNYGHVSNTIVDQTYQRKTFDRQSVTEDFKQGRKVVCLTGLDKTDTNSRQLWTNG